MRKLLVAPATVAIFALLVASALAKPGGNGNGGGNSNGRGGQQVAVPSSIFLDEYSYLHLGGHVGLSTEAVGLAGWECFCGHDLVLPEPERRRHP